MSDTSKRARELLTGIAERDCYTSVNGEGVDNRRWSRGKEIPFDERETQEIWGFYLFGAHGCRVIGMVKHAHDADLIAAAPTLLTTLCGELEALEAQLAEVERKLAEARAPVAALRAWLKNDEPAFYLIDELWSVVNILDGKAE